MAIAIDQASLCVVGAQDGEKHYWLHLRIMPEGLVDARRLVDKKIDKKHVAEIKPYRDKRSTMANSYCWKLCDMIAEALRTTKEEIYRIAIKAVGVFDTVMVTPNAVDHYIKVWNSHGTGWVADDLGVTQTGHKIIACYYGSSTYNTAEMSRLIDYLIDEAKGIGLETATPDEISNMLSLWDEQTKQSH